MRILVGVVAYGPGKDYVLDSYLEMQEACILGSKHEITLAFAADMPSKDQRVKFRDTGHVYVEMKPGHVYAEDMLIEGREAFRSLAERGGFDKLCYQGIDCLWQGARDFDRVAGHDVPVVSALTCARNNSYFPIARRFKVDRSFEYRDGAPAITEEQEDIPGRELAEGGLIPSGFPGADAIFFRHDTFSVSTENHTPWYRRVAEGRPNIECMEYTVLELQRQGKQAYVDADVKVWHVHEDGIARMWSGIERPLGELSWT